MSNSKSVQCPSHERGLQGASQNRQRQTRSDATNTLMGLPRGLSGQESGCSTGDAGSIPGSGRSPGEGNANRLQYSHLENPTDRGAWCATVHRVAKSWTQLNDREHTGIQRGAQQSGPPGRERDSIAYGVRKAVHSGEEEKWVFLVGLPTFSNSLQATHPPPSLGSLQRV